MSNKHPNFKPRQLSRHSSRQMDDFDDYGEYAQTEKKYKALKVKPTIVDTEQKDAIPFFDPAVGDMNKMPELKTK